jgi:hypothetical protein
VPAVVIVRSLIIAPADMDTRPIRRDVAQRVVQDLDMKCRPLQEIGFVQVLKGSVMRHRQIGAIELQDKPSPDDRFIFFLHGSGDGFDISLVRRVIPVGLEHRHETRRGGCHEPFGNRDSGECGAQIGDVLGQRLTVANRHRGNTHGASCHIGTRHPLIGCEKVGMVPSVEPRLGRLVPGKPRQAVGDIGRIAGLRHLAVIDDVDTDLRLASHDVYDRLPRQASERSVIVGLSLILAHQQLAQFGRAWETPDMCG